MGLDIFRRYLSCDKDSVRVCGQDAAGNINGVITDNAGRIVVTDAASAYSQIGRLFSYNIFLVFNNSNTNHKLLFVNPVDNDRVMYLDKFVCGIVLRFQEDKQLNYENQMFIRINGDDTINTLGDLRDSTPLNLSIPLSSSTINIYENSDTSINLSRELFSTRLLNGLLTVDFNGRIIIPPGHNIVFSFENIAIAEPGQNLNLGGTIMYYEV